MRKETATKVAHLLAATASTLRECGRPRALPGQQRDEAQTLWGNRVRPTHPFARKFSLTGAVKMNAKKLGLSWYYVERAFFAITDAEGNYYGYCANSVKKLDSSEYDTRHVIRIVQKARRTLAKQYA